MSLTATHTLESFRIGSFLSDSFRFIDFVKLHSNLQTQLNFSWLEKELTLFSHRRREEGRNNPHLAFSRRNDPTCLNFADCLVCVWRVLGNCLEGVWQVSGGCLEGD